MIVIVIVAQVAAGVLGQGQAPGRGNAPAAPPPAAAGAGRAGGLGAAYDPRPPADLAQVERGKGLYGVRCTFCHGADARGGEGGPNLVRSGSILNDVNGEALRVYSRLSNGDLEFAMALRDDAGRERSL